MKRQSPDDSAGGNAGFWRSVVEDRFYFAMAAVTLLAVVYGYGLDLYMQSFGHKAAAPPILRLRSLLAILWAGLLAVQTFMAQVRGNRSHRAIGVWALLLGAAFSLIAALAVVAEAQMSHGRGDHGAARGLLQPLLNVVGFAILIAFAAYWRRSTLLHRRLMMLAGLILLVSALGRTSLAGAAAVFAGPLLDLLIIGCVVRDQAIRGRVHPVYFIVLPICILVQIGAPLLVRTPLWPPIAAPLMEMSVPLSSGAGG